MLASEPKKIYIVDNRESLIEFRCLGFQNSRNPFRGPCKARLRLEMVVEERRSPRELLSHAL